MCHSYSLLFLSPFFTNLRTHQPCRLRFSSPIRHKRCVNACAAPPVAAESPDILSVPFNSDQTAISGYCDDDNIESAAASVFDSCEDVQAESLRLLEWGEISRHVARFATTALGREALGRGILLPIPTSRIESERLLTETREAYTLCYRLNRPLPLSGAEDVRVVVKDAAKGRVLSGIDLLRVAHTLAVARRVRRHIDAVSTVGTTTTEEDDMQTKFERLHALVEDFRTWPEKERMISEKLDDYGMVDDAADPELAGIRSEMRQVTSAIRGKLNDIMAKNADSIQERVITTRYDRYVILVKMSRKGVFRTGTVHDVSATGGTAYIEPASVRGMNDKLRQLMAKEKARVNAVLKALSQEVVAPIAEDVLHLSQALAAIDAANARANAAYSLDAVEVRFDDENPLRLDCMRHPLLAWNAMASEEAQQEANESSKKYSDSEESARRKSARFVMPKEPFWKRKVVPSTYELAENVRCVCVTGPNTGGKTIALKTLGVAALMAKAGLFLPAALPQYSGHGHDGVVRIPYFDKVLADIGDDQSLVQSLSTFSGHIERIKRILAATTPRSLVLFDEIGSGTDPAEGAALGISILRHLAVGKRAALTFATTHHGELKTLKYATGECASLFENASVEFDDVEMRPTYRLLWGIPGRSNALSIAKRLGLSDEIISDAQAQLSGSDDGRRIDVEKMIGGLEAAQRKADGLREEAENASTEASFLRNELRIRLKRLEDDEKKLRAEQRAAIDRELTDARASIAKVIKTLQQRGGDASAAAHASSRIDSLAIQHKRAGMTQIAKKNEGEKMIDVSELKVGDEVVVERLGEAPLSVVELLGKDQFAVAVGGMRATVKAKEISQVFPKRMAVTPQTRTFAQKKKNAIRVKTAANTVDVRGERVDEAVGKVENAISRAMAIGVLWVVHGHGTGRLRTGIREALRTNELVERFEDAKQDEGGTGVTLAFLR